MSEFIPNYTGKVKRDPLAGDDHCEFPIDEVFDRVDGLSASVLNFDTAPGREQLARFAREFISACVRGKYGGGDHATGKGAVQRIGLRTVVIAWLLEPAIFNGAPMSQARLAAHLGVCQKTLSENAAKLSAELGIQNRFQAHYRGGRRGNPAKTEQRDVERDERNGGFQ